MTRGRCEYVRGPALALVLALCVGCAPDVGTPLGHVDQTPARACGDELTLTGRVVDAANVLPPAARNELARRLEAYERRTHHQLVVVTTPSLGGSDINLYSIRLFRRWGIGRRHINDGIGFLIAPTDHKVRIEVGYGLERALPDDVTAKILRDVVLPRFRAGDVTGAIGSGAGAITAAIDRAESQKGRSL